MPPLVVIRSGAKHVEYKENRSVWRRLGATSGDGSVSDSDSDSSSRSEDDAQAERQLLDASGRHSAAYGPSSELREAEDMRAFRCADCGAVVADREDVMSKTFYGRTGKAFLMHSMFNVNVGSARNRYLMTGMHTIADVSCERCAAVLGWKYLKAMEASQKYKEGKFIMESAVVEDDWEERAWGRR